MVVLFCQFCCLFVCYRPYHINGASNSPCSIHHPRSATFNGQSHQQCVTFAVRPLSTQQHSSKRGAPSHKRFPRSRFNKQVLQVYCAPRRSPKLQASLFKLYKSARRSLKILSSINPFSILPTHVNVFPQTPPQILICLIWLNSQYDTSILCRRQVLQTPRPSKGRTLLIF